MYFYYLCQLIISDMKKFIVLAIVSISVFAACKDDDKDDKPQPVPVYDCTKEGYYMYVTKMNQTDNAINYVIKIGSKSYAGDTQINDTIPICMNDYAFIWIDTTQSSSIYNNVGNYKKAITNEGVQTIKNDTFFFVGSTKYTHASLAKLSKF